MTTTKKRAYLTGDTYTFRSILKDHNWKFDGNRKEWYKDAEWDSESEVISVVRSYGGIRNRGKFEASLEEIA